MPRTKRPLRSAVARRPARRRRDRHSEAARLSPGLLGAGLRPWDEEDWGAAAIELRLFPEAESAGGEVGPRFDR